MTSRAVARLTVVVFSGLLAIACSGTITDDVVVGERPPTPSFSDSTDAGTDGPAWELTEYCPSNKCPTGFTTCQTSTFLCDVDLRSDPNNCGACGAECPGYGPGALFVCIEGHCVMQCDRLNLDCDGLIENGCEADEDDNDSCGECGIVCDETAPCISEGSAFPKCGCDAPKSYCAGANPECQDLSTSDKNCGECGSACDPAGGPGAPALLPNTVYGCAEGECGHLKCLAGFGDCNMDVGRPDSDGCEARLTTHENCQFCGDNCLDLGMHCVSAGLEGIACRCPPGENFCGSTASEPYVGACANFTSDPKNCGACGQACPGTTKRSKGTCVYGTCKVECVGRWADCNGNVDDDCEVDTFGDPMNCGGCGITCDIAAGQACAGGRCVVEPCDEQGAVESR